MKYRVNDWHEDDEWTEVVDEKITDLRWLAISIAEDFYQKDPCAPEDFNLTIQIIDNKDVLHTYKSSAEVDIIFTVTKVYENN